LAKVDGPATRQARGPASVVLARTRQPLYVQVRTELGESLSRYRAGDRLPSEPELAASYGVSRPTIRDVLRSLENEGRVRRVHGVGTFVNATPSKVTSAVNADLGVTEAVQAAQRTLGVQVLSIRGAAAPSDVAEQLGVETGDDLLWIERLIRADERRAALAVDVIPNRIARTARRPYRDGSVYRFLETECGLSLRGGVARITAVSADRRVARLLGVPNGAALLRLEQVERANDGVACLYSLEHYVPSVFDLTVRRTRRSSEAG
jgi:GntR family transcriptional regulator